MELRKEEKEGREWLISVWGTFSCLALLFNLTEWLNLWAARGILSGQSGSRFADSATLSSQINS